MPDFLEKKLRAEYGNNPRAIYGTMNNIGAMHGNKITAKGREMERKHEKDMAKNKAAVSAPHNIREIRIEVHRDKHNNVTGHTVHHHLMPRKTSKSGAFMEETHESFPFGPKQHNEMADHIHQALGGASEPEEEEEEEGEEA